VLNRAVLTFAFGAQTFQMGHLTHTHTKVFVVSPTDALLVLFWL